MFYGREAIDYLEKGYDRVVLKVSMRSFMPELLMTKVENGERGETTQVISCVLVLGQHIGKTKYEYVHVTTFYPTSDEIHGEYTIEKY